MPTHHDPTEMKLTIYTLCYVRYVASNYRTLLFLFERINHSPMHAEAYPLFHNLQRRFHMT